MNRGFCKEQKPLFQPKKVNFRRRISAEASAEDHRRSLGRSQLRFNTALCVFVVGQKPHIKQQPPFMWQGLAPFALFLVWHFFGTFDLIRKSLRFGYLL